MNQAYWNVLIEHESVGKVEEEGVGKKAMLSDQKGKEMQNQLINLGIYVKAGMQKYILR